MFSFYVNKKNYRWNALIIRFIRLFFSLLLVDEIFADIDCMFPFPIQGNDFLFF